MNKMWLALTGINILGGIVAIIVLILTVCRYEITPRMKRYALLRAAGMVMLIFGQLISLTNTGMWPVKFVTFYWWGTVLVFCDAIRYSCLRKNGNGKDVKFVSKQAL